MTVIPSLRRLVFLASASIGSGRKETHHDQRHNDAKEDQQQDDGRRPSYTTLSGADTLQFLHGRPERIDKLLHGGHGFWDNFTGNLLELTIQKELSHSRFDSLPLVPKEPALVKVNESREASVGVQHTWIQVNRQITQRMR